MCLKHLKLKKELELYNFAMYREYQLETYSDDKGQLTPIEFADLNLFNIKRIYFVHNNLTKRGGHAHLKEEEFFIMSSGECIAKLHDGKNWIEVKLVAGENGLYVGNMIWHEFDLFSEGAVLTALSSTSYNSDRLDYIEDFNKFINV